MKWWCHGLAGDYQREKRGEPIGRQESCGFKCVSAEWVLRSEGSPIGVIDVVQWQVPPFYIKGEVGRVVGVPEDTALETRPYET